MEHNTAWARELFVSEYFAELERGNPDKSWLAPLHKVWIALVL
jgi:hypothetical protein